MFIGLSTTLLKFGKFRIGLRVTKKNAIWMLFVLAFVYTMQACWYMMVFVLWLIYAMIYGLFWAMKKLVRFIISKIRGE